MRIRNARLVLVYRSVLAILGAVTLILQLNIFPGPFNVNFFHFFTNLSGVGVVVYLAGSVVYMLRHKVDGRLDSSVVWAPNFKYAILMAISVTGLIAHFMLSHLLFENGSLDVTLLILHYIIPIGMVLDWLLFDTKGHMTATGPLVWVMFPLAYVIYIMVGVNVFGLFMGAPKLGPSSYPYTFLDVDALGVGPVVLFIVAMLVAFIALGYLYFAIDRALAKRAK